jgi:hypothetical protein
VTLLSIIAAFAVTFFVARPRSRQRWTRRQYGAPFANEMRHLAERARRKNA